MVMLEELLSQKKSTIVRKWFEVILASYPDDSRRFLRSQRNRFANPVGHTISQGAEALFEGLLRGMVPQETSAFLDNLIRIRAVQDFSPSQAVAFIFQLKSVIRDALRNEIREKAVNDALIKFESRIDELGLLAFDIYMRCRQRLYELRANEMRRSTIRLLKKTKLFYDIEQQDPDMEAMEFDHSE
jgi:hypothetical protein